MWVIWWAFNIIGTNTSRLSWQTQISAYLVLNLNWFIQRSEFILPSQIVLRHLILNGINIHDGFPKTGLPIGPEEN